MNINSTDKAILDFLKNLIKDTHFENKVFLAGGAVRDFLLDPNKPSSDLDFVIDAKHGGIDFANWVTTECGVWKEESNPVIFPVYGTAKLVLNGIKHKGFDLEAIDIECVMPRAEKYSSQSRKPTVYNSTLEEDAFRRDFTFNSLFLNISNGDIIDFTGKGKTDLENGLIDTPIDPEIIFRDDPLRMLRAVRFYARFGWNIADHLIERIVKDASNLQHISEERIREELNKILISDRPAEGIKLLQDLGLSQYIFPELDEQIGVTQNAHHKDDVRDHILEVVSNTPKNLIIRLQALFHDIGKKKTKSIGEDGKIHFYYHEDVGAKIAQEIMGRLKYSNEEAKRVSNGVKHHMRLKQAGPDGNNFSNKALRKFIHSIGTDLDTTLELIHADNISHAEGSQMPDQINRIKERIKELDYTHKSKPPITGNDIISHFNLEAGPIIGQLMNVAKEEFVSNPKITKEEIFDKLTNSLSQQYNG
jgi:poly(A) polymerase